jgi:outer membrane cobalamin receptor
MSPVSRILFPVAFVVWLSACSHGTRATEEGVIITPEGNRIITQVIITRSGAKTAWDALQRTVPFFEFREDSRGDPSRIDHRGRSSIVLSDQPMILVDGVELTDFKVLGGMPASDLLKIEVLSGIDATTRYGTNATKGVIRIWTRLGSS